jgi:hypothetical protein
LWSFSIGFLTMLKSIQNKNKNVKIIENLTRKTWCCVQYIYAARTSTKSLGAFLTLFDAKHQLQNFTEITE